MGSGLSTKATVVLKADSTDYSEPSGGGDGVDLIPSRDGGYLPDRAIVLVRKGASAGPGDVTLSGPVYVDLYIRGNWYKSGALNGGADITVGDTGWAERIEDVGAATRASAHAASNPTSQVQTELVFIDDDDE